MKTLFSLILTFVACYTVAEAARRVDAQLRAKVTMQRRRELSAHMKRDLEPIDTITLFELTEDEDLEQSTEMPAASGMTVEKLKETYKGIEVYDTSVAVRKDKNGQLTGDAVGQLVQGIDEDIQDINGLLSDDETIAIAANAEGDSVDLLQDITVRRQIFVDNNDKAHLANFVSYRVLGFKRPMYIIDKNDGTILRHWEGLTTYPCCEKGKFHGIGGNEKMGKFTYGSMPYCVMPTIVDDFCILENEYVRVVDMKNEYRLYNETIDTVASFECMVGYNDSVNGAYSPALDAFFYGTVVGKMYEEWFGQAALKEKIELRVHFGEMLAHAFWDGKAGTFGDGNNEMHPLTGLDVVSHEIAHGVTEQASGLEYWDESGGMNEAFSDIMGEAADMYLQFNPSLLVGEDVLKSRPYLREFENPSNDRNNRSISHVSEMTNFTDPHHSSGVYRRVFYLLTKTHGLPIRETAGVFLRANRLYWHKTASFYETSCGLLQAAIDLGVDTIPFRSAFADVGIDKCNVKSHIYTLNNNVTAQNNTVGEFVHPTYRFESPKWADILIVSTSVYSDNDVHIRVMRDGWEETVDPCDGGGTLVAEGENYLTIDSATDAEYFITLSPSNANTSYSGPLFVDLTIGYTCQTDWYGPYMDKLFYRKHCGF